MSWQQVKAPNTGVTCKPGWCLKYVQDAFSTGWAGATATDGWNRAQLKHSDAFPNGVAVPVWFAMKGEPAGHVAIRMPDGSYYSTSHPTNTTAYHHPNLQHLLDYYSGRLTLRGWSEDLNGERVIREGGIVDGNVTISKAEYEDLKNWKAVGIDALPYKQQVVKSKAWSSAADMSYVVERIAPSIDDMYGHKYGDKPSQPTEPHVPDVRVDGVEYVPKGKQK